MQKNLNKSNTYKFSDKKWWKRCKKQRNKSDTWMCKIQILHTAVFRCIKVRLVHTLHTFYFYDHVFLYNLWWLIMMIELIWLLFPPPPLSLKASPPKAKQNKFDKSKRKKLKNNSEECVHMCSTKQFWLTRYL